MYVMKYCAFQGHRGYEYHRRGPCVLWGSWRWRVQSPLILGSKNVCRSFLFRWNAFLAKMDGKLIPESRKGHGGGKYAPRLFALGGKTEHHNGGIF